MLVMLRPERLADIAVERVVLAVDTHLPPADWTPVYWTEISSVFWDSFKIHDTHLPTRYSLHGIYRSGLSGSMDRRLSLIPSGHVLPHAWQAPCRLGCGQRDRGRLP